MKKTVYKMFFILLAIFLYGCPNEGPYYMYTKINPDGSCYREFIRGADSTFVLRKDTSHNPFPMKLDSTWKISFYKRMQGDTSRFRNFSASETIKMNNTEFSWFAIARKDYQSLQELNESFRYDNSDWNKVATEIEYNKRFRWFYTYYEFQESYKGSNPFKIVPFSVYLTDQEVAALYGEDKELYKGKNGFEIKEILTDLENKADKWLEHSLFEEVFQLYLQHYRQFDAPVDSISFAAEKDTIFKYYIATDSIDFEDIGDVLDHHFHTNVYSAGGDSLDKELESMFPEFLAFSGTELNYQMTMPGKIIETNAPFLQNDTLIWRVEDERFFFNDYQLKAVSRKANYWSFGVTGIVIVLSVLGLLIRRKHL
jgi:hypothetical protein